MSLLSAAKNNSAEYLKKTQSTFFGGPYIRRVRAASAAWYQNRTSLKGTYMSARLCMLTVAATVLCLALLGCQNSDSDGGMMGMGMSKDQMMSKGDQMMVDGQKMVDEGQSKRNQGMTMDGDQMIKKGHMTMDDGQMMKDKAMMMK